jgi:hypothetical protein
MSFDPSIWGTVADWVGGIGTSLAFVATFVVILRDARVRRYTQSRKVVYVVETTKPIPLPGSGHEDIALDEQTRFVVKNLSDEPVYDVLHYLHSSRNHRRELLALKTVLLPGEETAYESDKYSVSEGPRVTFRDNSGWFWNRSIDGHLRPGTGIWMYRRKLQRPVR